MRRFEDYVASLDKAKVVLDANRRKEIILADARNLALAQGLELVEDEGLLEEVAGLVEWPVVLMGEFEAAFLEIPAEVIRATIRANQKCFVLRDGAGKLADHFILVANIAASDGGAAIAAGNGRVVRARLSDARHFWLTDLAPLPDYQATRRTSRSISGSRNCARSTSCFTKSSARKASASIGSPPSRANWRRRSAPTRRSPSAPRFSRRPISSRKWSANSPNFRD